ncbi:MAG: hypothetical protein Kow0031_03290 [Anaerolineae bacterium]
MLGLTFLFTWPSLAQSPPGKGQPPFAPGELLVKFQPQAGLAVQQTSLRQAGASLLETLPHSQWQRVRVPVGHELAAQARLMALPGVVAAGPNYLLTTAQTPNDPGFSTQWSLHNPAPPSTGGDIDAPAAWGIHTGGSATIVAIADTGIDLDHEDLAARIWVNPGEIPNNNIDDDNNGFVDDVNGWNFCPTSGCPTENNNPNDDNGHGTHVAGIAGASGNNGKGISGVGWNFTLMPLKVAYNAGSSGSATIASVVKGINYAADNGASVVNLSLVSTSATPPCAATFDPVQEAAQRALSLGTLVVFAAGNQGDNQVHCPANYPAVIAAGSTNRFDLRVSSSNYGPELDVTAPGDSIYSTYWPTPYATLSGTSMAAPHVAGLAGLVHSFDASLKAQDVRGIIESTADDLGAAGRDDFYGHGRINARRALEALVQVRLADGSQSQQMLLAGNDPAPLPKTTVVQLVADNPAAVTRTAVISPAVSWLSIAPATGLSAAASPLDVTLVFTRPTPAVAGTYTTTVVVNTATTGGQPLGTRTVDVTLTYVNKAQFYYLPVIFKGYFPAPDLVVEHLVASSDGVTVTIRNQGDEPVTDSFWVDVYFDPAQPPELNQPWPTLASHGQVWGVAQSLAPGESLTLTSGGPYFYPQYSSSLPLPAGADVYGFVDSVNFETNYGNVREQNEGNNRSVKVISTGGAGSSGAMSLPEAVPGRLPPR